MPTAPLSGDWPLALTMGDPAGIGLELAITAWQQRHANNIAPFCLYGCANALRERARLVGCEVPIEIVASPTATRIAFARALPVIDLPLAETAIAGQPSSANGAAIIQAIDRAVGDVHAGLVAAVVTNPIAKSILYQAGFRHPGHTEYLAALATFHWPGTSHVPVMMLASDALKVVPLTIHVPLADVPKLVTRSAISTTIAITADALRRSFGIANPRIAIAGLNPHAGEHATIGLEERDVIIPALNDSREAGLTLIGPLSADTLFHAAARKTYDTVICMYHDQALIPIKTLAFDTGVNVTLGLPFVRTSPDHGTAFDIAGQGIASPSSLIEALKMAAAMAARQATLR